MSDKDRPSSSSSSSASAFLLLDSGDGQQFLLSSDPDNHCDTDRPESPNSTTDILQQALQEVTSMENVKLTAASSGVNGLLSGADNDLSFLLDTNSSSSASCFIDAAAAAASSAPADAVTAPSAVSNEQLLDELASVAANTTAAASLFGEEATPHHQPEEQVVTVVRGADGSVRLAPSAAAAAPQPPPPPPQRQRRRKQTLPSFSNTSQSYSTPPPAKKPAPGLVLVTKPDGSQVLVLNNAADKPQSSNITTSRPAILARKSLPQGQYGANAPLIMMRPVMTPSVAAPASSLARAALKTPYILPKLAVAPKPAPQVVTTAKRDLGTSSNPIQLIQRGNRFHTDQSLSDSQLSQVAGIIKRSTPEIPLEQTEIVVDKGGQKMVYKVVLSEDSAEQVKKPAKKTAVTNKEKEVKVREVFPDELFPDSELAKRLTAEAKAKLVRKRGRPRLDEQPRSSAESHAKSLQDEFGFNKATAEAVENDIVPDERIANDDNDEERVPNVSWTRSGRLSKPPPAKDDFRSSTKASNKQAEPPPLVLEPQPKKKYEVPDRYRCRVCNKVYIGDRKMNR